MNQSRHRLRTALVSLFLALALVVSMRIVPSVYASGLQCIDQGSGVTCTPFKDVNGQTLNHYQFSSSSTYNAWVQMNLRSFVYSGTGDNERYTLFEMTITQNPDPGNNIDDTAWAGPDSSISGSSSTIETRLWSTNSRSGCQGSPCTQQNMPDLEPNDTCDSSGSSITLSATLPVQAGSIGWSDTFTPDTSCTYVPGGVDVYSRYYNYTLQDSGREATQLNVEFIFSQWEYNNTWGRTIDIGYSTFAQFAKYGILSTLYKVSSGNLSDNYNY